MESTATIKLKAEDGGIVATVNQVSGVMTNLSLAATALQFGFKGLEKASSSSFTQMVLGQKNAQGLADSLKQVVAVNSVAVKALSTASDISFWAAQATTAVVGVRDAIREFANIPQTLALMNSSGVSTQSIEQFRGITEAISGSREAAEGLAVSAVTALNRFEQASSRAGTILRSSVNFDEFGGAKRANQSERMENALQVQKMVNAELKNSVSSTEALTGQYEVLSSGFTKAADSQKVLADGAKLIGIGQAGGMYADSAETLKLLTKTLNAYEEGADKSGITAAKLNAIVESGLTTIQELSQGFGQTAKSAKQANIDLDNLSASVAVLTTQGISTSQSLTGIERLSANIINKTPEAEKALAKLSLNGQKIRFDTAEIQAKGFTQALLDLWEAAGKSPQVLSEILPEDLAFRTAIALLAEDGNKLKNTLGSVASATEQGLNDVFEIATSDRVSRFAQIANRFQELVIGVGQSLAPVFEPGIATLERMASFFANLPEPVKQAIGTFISLKITSFAASNALGILGQTGLSLINSYMQVRLISLALSGQLGNEIGVVKNLITQRQGLFAAGLQVLGIDQRWRLSAEATAAAVQKQSVVTKVLSGVQEKAGAIIQANVSGFQSVNSAIASTGNIAQTATGKVQAFFGAIASSNTAQNLKAQAQSLVQNNQTINAIANSASSLGSAIKQDINNIALGNAPRQLDLFDTTPYIDRKAQVAQIANSIQSQVQTAQTALAGALSNQQPQYVQLELFPDPKTTQVQTAAIAQGAQAVTAATVATKAHTATVVAAELAEKGLAQTRLFGNNIVFATSGPLGAVNKLLASEVNIKKALSVANVALNKTISITEKGLQGVGAAGAMGIGGLVKTVQKAAIPAFSTLVGTLGPLAPLLGVVGAGAFLLRDQIWGLGAASRDLAKAFEEARTKQDELQKQLGKDERLLNFKGQINSLEESLNNVDPNKRSAQIAKLNLPQVQPDKSFLQQATDTVATPFKQIGEAINKSLNKDVVAPTAALPDQLKPLREQLQQLRSSGDLTSGQFNQLSISLSEVAKGSDISKEKLAALKSQLDAIRQGAPGKPDQGVLDSAKEFVTKIPGWLGGGIDNIANTVGYAATGGIFKDLAQGKSIGSGFGEIAKNREADSLIKPMSELALATEQVGDRILATAEANSKYRKGLLQTEGVNEKIRQGFKLTAQDLEVEKQSYERNNQLNESQIANLEKTREQQQKVLEGIKDPELKEQFQTQIDLLNSQIDTLKKRNDAMKESYETILKYQQETLPILQRAIVGEADPTKTYNNLLESFSNKYSDDNKTFIKDLSKLRTEAQSVIDQTLQNYDRNVAGFDAKGVAEKLTNVLDNSTIEVMVEGKPVKGSYLDIESRKALAKQISEFEAGNLKEQQDKLKGDVDIYKAQQQQRVLSVEQAEDKIAAAQIDSSKLQLSQLDKQIELYKKYNLRTVELEGQARVLREQIKADEVANEDRLYERRLEKRKQQLANEAQAQTQALQSQINQSQLQSKDLELGRSLQDSRLSLIQTRAGAEDQRSQNEKKLTGDITKRADIEVKLADRRAKLLTITQDAEQRSLKTQTLLNQLASDREITQNRIAQIENQRNLATARLELEKAKREKQTPEQLKGLELQVQSLENQQGLLQQQGTQLEQSKNIQAQIAKNSQEELKIKQQSARESAEVEKALARREQIQARLENQAKVAANQAQKQVLAMQLQVEKSNLMAKSLEMAKQVEDSRVSVVQAQQQAEETRLSNQAKLTGNVLKRADIEVKIAEKRSSNLAISQAAEARSLVINQQLSALSLEREKTQNRIAIVENNRAIVQAQIELQRAQLEKRSPAEIESAKLQVTSLTQQKGLLQDQGRQLAKQSQQQNQINANAQKQLTITQSTARESAQVEITLAKRAQLQAQMEEQGRKLTNDGQQQALILQAQVSASERRIKLLELTKQLEDSRNQVLQATISADETRLQNEAKLTQNSLRRAEIEVQLAQNRARSLVINQQVERANLQIQQQQSALSLQREQIENRRAKAENQRNILQAQFDLRRAQIEGQSPEQIRAIQLQLESYRQQGQELNNQSGMLAKQSQQQSEINTNAQKQLAITQSTARESAQVEVTLAKRAQLQAQREEALKRFNNETQRQILGLESGNKALANQTKNLELQKSLVESRTQLTQTQQQNEEARLQNQLKLTGDIVTRATIERQMAEARLNNLSRTQESELRSLGINQQIAALNLEQEASSNRIAQIENQRSILQTQMELSKARMEGRSRAEIEAIELQVMSLKEQGKQLTNQEGFLQKQKTTQLEINQNAEAELRSRQAVARETAQIEASLSRHAELSAKIEKQVRQIELAERSRQLNAEAQVQKQEALTSALDKQKTLLEAQKTLLDSRTNRVTSDLQLAIEATKSENRKKQLAETIAGIKLRSLTAQQQMERQVLELNLAQQKAQLETEKIRNRMAQSQNLAEVAKARAELSKTLASPTASAEDKQAALLDLRAKLEQQASLRFGAEMLDRQGLIQDTLANFQREGLGNQQRTAVDQARLELANNMSSESAKKAALRQLNQEVMSRLTGIPQNQVGQRSYQVGQMLDAFNRSNRGENLTPTQLMDAGAIGGRVATGVPQVAIPTVPDFERFRKDAIAQMQEFELKPIKVSVEQPELNLKANKGSAKPEGDKPTKTLQGDVILQNQIHIHLESKDQKDLGQKLEGEILNSMDNVWKIVEQRLRQ